MKTKVLAIIISVLLIILTGVMTATYLLSGTPNVQFQDVRVLTDKTEYAAGEPLKIKIENNGQEKICFSSCYPYYIQWRNGNWKNYVYEKCDKKNVVESCVEPKSIKAYELTLPELKRGIHRLFLSACVGCEIQQNFQSQESLFSNKFIIK